MKALYSLLIELLLLYNKLIKDIKEEVFMLNFYDPWVAKNMINRAQYTIVLHIDDLKLSHKQRKVVGEVVKWLRSKYKDTNIGIMKLIRLKMHEYLGTTLDLNEKGAVNLDMVDDVDKMVKYFQVDPKNMKNVSSPAVEYIFKVRESAANIDEMRANIFYNMVVRELFMAKRAWEDIHPTIAFLSMRVKNQTATTKRN